MATNKHRKKHLKKNLKKNITHRPNINTNTKVKRHYRKRHYKSSLKQYLSTDNADTNNVLNDTLIVSNSYNNENKGNIIHGLRDLLANKKK